MQRIFLPIISALILALFAACGNSDTFFVKGSVDGKPSMNLRIVYYFDGHVVSSVTAVREGNFEFMGHAPSQAIVEIYDNDYRLMGRFITTDGEQTELKLDRLNPYKLEVKGNELSNRWAKYLNKRAEMLISASSDERNDTIAQYVKNNPNDALSALLLITDFDCSSHARAVIADSLLATITPDARLNDLSKAFATTIERAGSAPSRAPIDSLIHLAPGNIPTTFVSSKQQLALIALSNDNSGRDTIIETLRKLVKDKHKKRFAVLDLSVDRDTLVWHTSIKNDTATWLQGWVAGGIAGQALDSLGIPTIPYYFAVDSIGNQLWRGTSLTEAQKIINEKL